MCSTYQRFTTIMDGIIGVNIFLFFFGVVIISFNEYTSRTDTLSFNNRSVWYVGGSKDEDMVLLSRRNNYL